MKSTDHHDNLNRYLETLIKAAENLPELADRDRHSPTYGCFSYPYWRSKSVDYSSARCQEAAYTLALLYSQPYPESPFSGKLEIKELAVGAVLYWASLQHGDGSFDEWYKGEHGFAATAFSSFAISRAYRLLQDGLSGEERDRLLGAFRRAARWLSRRDDLDKINHEAVGAAALFSLAQVLEDEGLAAVAAGKVEKVLARQTDEGWFPELGGVDTGYSFLTLEYLAQAYLSSRSERLKSALEKALGFLVFFVHPEITTGREYNLCGNSYVSLLAAAIMADFSPPARTLFREGIARGNVIAQLAQDDLSLCCHLYNGLLSWEHGRRSIEGETLPLPYQGEPFRKYFPRAGLLAVGEKDYYAVAGCRNGGLLKVFPVAGEGRAAEIACLDSGYTVSTPDGRKLRSSSRAGDNEIGPRPDGGVEVKARFRPTGYFFPHPLARLLLKLVSAVPGGYLIVKRGIDRVRRKKQASLQLAAVPGGPSRWSLQRTIAFREGEVSVEDRIDPGGSRVSPVEIDLEIREKGLTANRPLSNREEELKDRLSSDGRVVVEKVIKPKEGGIEVTFRLEGAESG